MKIKTDDLRNIHLPRWDEFPQFDLYIDQVIAFVNENLSIFNPSGDSLITPSMINNYVKNGVLPAPVKKKYSREHLAKLLIICIEKRMLSIADTAETIDAMSRSMGFSEGYNFYCDELEYAVFSTVFPNEYPVRSVADAETRELATMRSMTYAVANILVFDRIVGQRRRAIAVAKKMLDK